MRNIGVVLVLVIVLAACSGGGGGSSSSENSDGDDVGSSNILPIPGLCLPLQDILNSLCLAQDIKLGCETLSCGGEVETAGGVRSLHFFRPGSNDCEASNCNTLECASGLLFNLEVDANGLISAIVNIDGEETILDCVFQ